MSWIITGSFAQPDEPEALAYIAAVEAADGQALEDGVKFAYNSFIKGCKADGIWDAIKASCILAGARTLNGALVPLVGAAPTNYNFVSGDYNRETGLKGDGNTKYLNSNRAGNADPQDSFSLTTYLTELHTDSSNAGAYIGNGGTGTGASSLFRNRLSPVLVEHAGRCRASTQSGNQGANPPATGLLGVSRSASSSYTLRTGATNYTLNTASETPATGDFLVFAREDGAGSSSFPVNARLAFYSIGEALDLALLDSRVTTLMSDLAAAIP